MEEVALLGKLCTGLYLFVERGDEQCLFLLFFLLLFFYLLLLLLLLLFQLLVS